jgi:hypothetical protein
MDKRVVIDFTNKEAFKSTLKGYADKRLNLSISASDLVIGMIQGLPRIIKKDKPSRDYFKEVVSSAKEDILGLEIMDFIKKDLLKFLNMAVSYREAGLLLEYSSIDLNTLDRALSVVKKLNIEGLANFKNALAKVKKDLKEEGLDGNKHIYNSALLKSIDDYAYKVSYRGFFESGEEKRPYLDDKVISRYIKKKNEEDSAPVVTELDELIEVLKKDKAKSLEAFQQLIIKDDEFRELFQDYAKALEDFEKSETA